MAGKLGKKTNTEKPNELDFISTISLKCRSLPVPEVSQATGSVIVALLACLSFAGSLGGDFVFDDNEAILNNKDVRMETTLFSIFKHDFWGANITSATSHKSYRPLTVLTFRLNYWAAGGYNAVGFHLVNIILHVFNSLLSLRVFSVIFGGISVSKQGKKAFSSPKASVLAAILFAVHPIHTENVAGIVGRADLLCTFFFFVSFLTYARNFSTGARKTSSSLPERLPWPTLFVCIIVATLAILSKEQGITVLGICIVYDILQTVASKRSAISTLLASGVVKDNDMPWLKTLAKRMLILMVAIAMLLSWRMRIMGGSPPKFQAGDNPAAFATSWLLRVINYNYIYCVNLWLLLDPFWLCFDWSMGCIPLINSINDVRVLAPLLFWIFMAALVWKSYSTIDSHFGRTLLMLFAFVVVPFLPSANVFFTVGFVIAERNLYISSVGFIGIAVLGAVILSEAECLARIVKFGIYFLIPLFLLRCIQRSQDWLSEERLFLTGEAVCPLNAKVHYNIGKVLSEKGETDAAINYYRKSISLNPFYDQPLNNLGNILQKLGKPLEAEAMLTKAVSISPNFAAGWMNLGVTKASLQQFKDAEQCYLNAIKHRKFYPDAYYNLGNLFLEMKVYDKAIWNYKKVIELKPNHESSWINLVLLHDEIGKSNASLSIGKQALALLPKSASLLHAVGNLHAKADLYEEAERLFVKAVELDPSDASYVGNLAVLYHRWKRYREAEIYYLRSLKINPHNKVTVVNFRKLQKILGKE